MTRMTQMLIGLKRSKARCKREKRDTLTCYQTTKYRKMSWAMIRVPRLLISRLPRLNPICHNFQSHNGSKHLAPPAGKEIIMDGLSTRLPCPETHWREGVRQHRVR